MVDDVGCCYASHTSAHTGRLIRAAKKTSTHRIQSHSWEQYISGLKRGLSPFRDGDFGAFLNSSSCSSRSESSPLFEYEIFHFIHNHSTSTVLLEDLSEGTDLWWLITLALNCWRVLGLDCTTPVWRCSDFGFFWFWKPVHKLGGQYAQKVIKRLTASFSEAPTVFPSSHASVARSKFWSRISISFEAVSSTVPVRAFGDPVQDL